MSAQSNIKKAFQGVGAKVLSIKRQSDFYCVAIEIRGRQFTKYAGDPAKSNWESQKLFKRSLRELERLT